MRGRIGDEVELVNGKGQLAVGVATECKKREANLKILSVKESPPVCPALALAQALPKQNHLEWIIEKGTELGVTAFHLFPGDFSEKKELSSNQEKRCHHLLVAALKQSGRLHLPEIMMHRSINDLRLSKESTFFGDTRKDAPLFKTVEVGSQEGCITMVIGPEKGFSQNEVRYLDRCAKGVKLSPHTLRAETAAIAAMTLLSHSLLSGCTRH